MQLTTPTPALLEATGRQFPMRKNGTSQEADRAETAWDRKRGEVV